MKKETSPEGLHIFTAKISHITWMVHTCIDQYDFMEDTINSYKMHRLVLGLEKQCGHVAEVIMCQKEPYLPRFSKSLILFFLSLSLVSLLRMKLKNALCIERLILHFFF